MAMKASQRKAIDVLDRCLELQGDDGTEATRQQRLEELIAEFRKCGSEKVQPLEAADGWAFCVPSAFRSALDIKLTQRKVDGKPVMMWTQGSTFDFSAGDTIYDSPRAYEPWDLSTFSICLDIRRASPTQPPNGTDRKSRYPGTVIFDVLTPNDVRSKLEKRRETTLTQDEFVRMLILGPPPEWDDIEAPFALRSAD